MRAKSYNGFVILRKALEGSPNFVQSSEVTFLMTNDEILSAPQLSLDHIRNFVLTHTIPSSLVFNNMLHFPNGTLVPTGLLGKMLAVTSNHGLFQNNARIVNANVCVKSVIKCHGISSAISFDAPPPPTTIATHIQAPPPTTIATHIHAPSAADNVRALDFINSQKTRSRAKPSPTIHRKRDYPLS